MAKAPTQKPTSNKSRTIRPFAKLANVQPTAAGARAKDFRYVQEFLCRFGYMKEGEFHAGRLDERTEQALAEYQKNQGRRPTGEFNKATRDQMTTHRCGFPDMANGVAFSTTCSWDRRDLTYTFDSGTFDVLGGEEFQAVRNAFDTWAAVVDLTFTEVTVAESPDIEIGWRPAADPDLDMRGGTLAHADFPPACGIVTGANLPKPVHFDDEEHLWVIGARPGGFDVETVALHEIGHILGLAHSNVPGAVMFASVSSNTVKTQLTADDIAGIQALYPAAQGPTLPEQILDRLDRAEAELAELRSLAQSL